MTGSSTERTETATASAARGTGSSAAAEVVISAMRQPEFYPHRPSCVEMKETHISWVFLAKDRAYKVKKPVVFPFVDYGTLAQRRVMCHQEVELNRRLAPDTYLGVRSIVSRDGRLSLGDADAPEAVEYAVEMRRFDERRTLGMRLGAEQVGVEEINAVARRLAAFHAAQPAMSSDGVAQITRIKHMVNENFETLLPYAPLLGHDRLTAAERFVDAFLAARAATIMRRAEAGRVRDGHGDLRADHILLDRGIHVVDCVEFDPALRQVDVGEDLSFLVMDLTWRGAPDLGHELVRGYRASGGDPGDDALLAYHAAVRAWVRTKVACLRSTDPVGSDDQRTGAVAEARSLFALGERLAWQARGPLVLAICGVPGSGKSHLAAALHQTAGLAVVASDVVRKQLAGLAPTQRAGPERYTDTASRATYRRLGAEACAETQRRGGVIVDATFRRRADRDSFRDGFRACSAPVVFVECHAPADVIAVRARARDRRGGSVSDATAEVVERLGREFEPLDEISPECNVRVRTDRPVIDAVEDLAATLDRRLEALAPPAT